MPMFALGEKRPQLPAAGHFWIAPGAQVIGDVRIAVDVGIWFNAVLRGDNDPISIGRGTNIQDGVMIHTDLGFPTTIGDGCTIGHHAIIHGCTIGDNTLIGMGATVLNGAVIGKNCLVGANALVSEGKISRRFAHRRCAGPGRSHTGRQRHCAAQALGGKLRAELAAFFPRPKSTLRLRPRRQRTAPEFRSSSSQP